MPTEHISDSAVLISRLTPGIQQMVTLFC